MPATPGVWRLSAQVVANGRALADGWQQAPVDVRVWGDRGAVVQPQLVDLAPGLTMATLTAGQAAPVSVLIQNAGRLAWTVGDRYPVIAEQVDRTTTLRVTWVGSDGRRLPAIEPMTLTAAARQQLSVSLLLSAPDLVGRYSLEFDVRDGAGSLLPDDITPGTTLDVLVLAPATPAGGF
jgi:hypothetical protein